MSAIHQRDISNSKRNAVSAEGGIEGLLAMWLSVTLLLSSSFVQTIKAQSSPPNVESPPAISVEGVPKIPRSLSERASRYTSSRAATLQSWHPTKREMLITTRFADTVQVHLVRMPGGTRTQQTFLPSHVTWASFAPNQGAYFVFKMDDAGSEIYHLYRYDLACGDVTQLTTGDDSVSNVVWLKSDHGLVFSSATRDGENTDFVWLNPLAPQGARRLARVKGFGWDVMDVAPNDQQVLMSEFVSAEETAIHLLDVGTGTMKRITPPPDKEKVAYWNAAFSRDGKGVYLTTDQASEHARLAYFSPALGQSSWLPVKQQGAVESFALSPDGRRLAYIVNEEGIGRLRLFDVSAGRESDVPELPVGIVSNLIWHGHDEVGFNLETARYPADIYSLKVATRTIERWTYSETGSVRTGNFRDAELIHWRSFDGREISGFLYRPPGLRERAR